MNADMINFDMLFDASEYYRSGVCPWTFFAYPTEIAVTRGLPPDIEACELIGHLQKRKIDVSIWVNGIADDTTYFACRKDDIQRLNNALQELEDAGVIEQNFCGIRSELLFSKIRNGTAPSDPSKPTEGRKFGPKFFGGDMGDRGRSSD